MSYQVLARKWRPRTFHELVGQEHVQRALVNALDQGRLHHAYLFTGTRGVGKTTLARILAKCLNCENGVTSSPCGQCSTCREIDDGRFVDLIEVDAASRTKVEDTRELLDNVQYAPTHGRYKVYLIDEVHMLSTHSFNALLKTLEEPPPHVKFLLATTDPQKLPVTVLSRCLQFTLKNMPPERIVEHLAKVLQAEGVPFDESALWLLGKAADGSMRDAMSLTDQAIAFGQGEIVRADVAAMLGTLDHRHMLALVEALAEVDAARVLAEIASLAEQGPDFAGVLDDLAGVFHRLAIAQMVPEALDNGHGDRDELLALAARFTAEDVQLYYQIGLQGRADMESAPDTRTALEMTLLRMLAFRPQGVPKPAQTPLPLRGQQAETPSRSDIDTGANVTERPPVQQSPPVQTAPAPSRGVPDAPVSESAKAGERGASQPLAESKPATDGERLGGQDEEPPPWEYAQDARQDLSAEEGSVASAEGDPVPVAAMSEAAPVAEAPAPATPVAEEAVPPLPPADMPAESAEATTTVAASSAFASPEAQAVTQPQGTGPLDHAAWLDLFPRLSLAGLTRNLAAHCIVDHDDGQTVQLRLAPSQAAMNAEVHVERIRQALAGAGLERRVLIEPAELPEGIETPKARSDREAAERHASAVEALRDDPHIQQLEQAFGARLLVQTVSPQGQAE